MRFPLDLRFKIVAIAPQISVTDASGELLMYVKQRAFKLKESVTVFRDADQTRPIYRIAADRVLDISAQYRIDDEGGSPLGVLRRQGMRSLWRAHYEVYRGGVPFLTIREEKPWVKLVDGLVGEIPILGLFTGYVLHPEAAGVPGRTVHHRAGDGAGPARADPRGPRGAHDAPARAATRLTSKRAAVGGAR